MDIEIKAQIQTFKLPHGECCFSTCYRKVNPKHHTRIVTVRGGNEIIGVFCSNRCAIKYTKTLATNL